MRVAFYAPMKPPDDPLPSGDRRMARLLLRALGRAGHRATVVSRLRARDGAGNPRRQAAIRRRAERVVAAFVARHRVDPPDLWFTYHVYYKAPDWLGPAVAAALRIPYVIAEASDAPKRQGGPWDIGHRAARAAIAAAHRIVTFNPDDAPGLRPNVAHARCIAPMKPFLDAVPYAAARTLRDRHRETLAARHHLPPAAAWAVAVAMMRPGDKLASYRMLAEGWRRAGAPDAALLIAGDGPAARQVGDAFADLPRVWFLGRLDERALAALLAASDLFVWPAVSEAYGMAMLEAQAAGLPVLAGRMPGVAEVVADGCTGALTPPGDGAAFAAALRSLLADAPLRQRMSAAALAKVAARHTLPMAAARLDEILREALTEAAA